jgi:hypothetical protein
MKEVIKEIFGDNEEERKKMEDKAMRGVNRVRDLQKNMEFFKEMLSVSDSLLQTIEFAKEEGSRVDIVSMSELLTGTLVMLEEKGFITIAEKKNKK